MDSNLVKNADGDEFRIYFDYDAECFRAEQRTGLSKAYLNIPASLHAKSKAVLIREIRQHRSPW